VLGGGQSNAGGTKRLFVQNNPMALILGKRLRETLKGAGKKDTLSSENERKPDPQNAQKNLQKKWAALAKWEGGGDGEGSLKGIESTIRH